MTTCPYCKREFKTERGLNVHIARWCPMAGCPICYGGIGLVCGWHWL